MEAGDNALIAGFFITGSSSKKVLIRGIGPSLANAGVAGTLQDPVLELDRDAATRKVNDNWQDDATQASQLTNIGISPSDSLESAVVATLPPGAYTAVVAGKNGTSGTALVEVYNIP